MLLSPMAGPSGRDRHRQVFLDASGQRHRLLRRLGGLGLLLVLLWVAAFAAGLGIMAHLPRSPPPDGAVPLPRDAALDCPPRDAGPERAFAIIGTGPAGNLGAIADGCARIDVILADWASVDAASGVVGPFAATPRTEALLRAAIRHGAPGRPVDLVLSLTLPRPLAEDARRLDDAGARAGLVAVIMAYRRQTDARGLCLRPEHVAPNQIVGLRMLLDDLRAALGPAPLCLLVEPGDRIWQDASLVQAVDRIVIEGFRRVRAGTGPTGLAPPDWFEGLLQDAAGAIPPERLVIALGSFAARWVDGALADPDMPVAEAFRLIEGHDAEVVFDPARGESRAQFTDAMGRRNEIVLLDAAALANQRLAHKAAGQASGLALSRAGTEDPAAWEIVLGDLGTGLEQARHVRFGNHVGREGDGPFLRVTELAATGERHFLHDPVSGRVSSVQWAVLPRPFTLDHWGSRPSGKVALTFDDGPDPAHTKQILDVLARSEVPATFFITGRNAVGQTDLLRRMVGEGHLIGSHSYSHLRTEDASTWRLRLELNALERFVEGATGRGMRLYRSPYGQTDGPVDAEGAAGLAVAQQAGFMVVGTDIAPRDWETRDPEAILAEIRAALDPSQGAQVIALHDAGGDRSATVAALPRLIAEVRTAGLDFVPLTALAGLPPETVMPVRDDLLSRIDWLTLTVVESAGTALQWAFWVVLVAGAGRAFAMLVLAHLRRRHRARQAAHGHLPAVTVVIPAFNEGKGIGRCVASALALDWPDLRVLVVDDGSTDGTAAAVQAIRDGRVDLMRQPNAGKARALAAAYQRVQTELVLAIDADTTIAPDALRWMVPHFADPAVAAVSGRVLVNNPGHLLTGLQALEYVTAQGIDRRGAEALGTMLVVPGAIGLWRRAAVLSVGGPSAETLAEDADLTVCLLRAGHLVIYDERATSSTDVPDTWAGLLRQRRRWGFGMMQTAWKHRRAWRSRRRLGLLALPDLWLFGVGLGLVAPLADLVLVGVLAGAALDMMQGAPPLAETADRRIALAYLLLPAIDLVTLLLAMRFDRGTGLRLLLLLPFQRLLYRPVLYAALWRAVWLAGSGLPTPWDAAPTGDGRSAEGAAPV